MEENKSIEKKITFFNRISVRVTLIILGVLSLGIGTTIAYYLSSQNSTILSSRKGAVMEEATVIYMAVKNNMLSGEAPVAVELFNDFTRIETVGDIRLYRPDGRRAFSDKTTVRDVNRRLGKKQFKKTTFLPPDKISNAAFKESVKMVDDISHVVQTGREHSIVLYKPLINQPKCSGCHGTDHVIRGVIKISSPLTEVYEKTRLNTVISVIIYATVVFLLLAAIVYFIQQLVIRRIFNIGTVVEGVGRGDFQTKIFGTRADELGLLGRQINDMIDGLHERFKLSKFVSRSTLEHVRSEGDIILGGEKKKLTVLFSDIRQFTSYSEKRDPHDVMVMLNDMMNLQGEIIIRHGGDIDKFVGDEIMAVFDGDDMEMRAIKAALSIRDVMKKKFSEEEHPVAVGIGINTGEMISGNMGSGDRLDRTVIGDAVNLGARLCSIAGPGTIVISEFTFQQVRNLVDIREHDPIHVKGKEEKVKIYTLRSVREGKDT